MSGTKHIVWTLRPVRETAETICHAVFLEFFLPACQYLMSIGLMTHVEDNLVGGSIEYIMETHYELHRSKAGGEVAGIVRAAVDYIFTDLAAEGLQPVGVESTDVLRIINAVENIAHLS